MFCLFLSTSFHLFAAQTLVCTPIFPRPFPSTLSLTSNTASSPSLGCSCRWAVSGTPIQNQLDDLFGLLNYLKLAPLNERNVSAAAGVCRIASRGGSGGRQCECS